MKKQVDRIHSAKRLVSLYQSAFSGDAGRRVLKDMAREYHLGASTIVPGDTHGTYFHEGQRNVLLRIFRILKIDVATYLEQPEDEEASHV